MSSGAILLASAATLASARQLEGGAEENWVYIDMAQGLMVAAELAQLFTEARQLARQDILSYFSSPWNLMDVGAAVALIVGAVGTFQRSAEIVHHFGALGVALKWFSTVRGSAISYVRLLAVLWAYSCRHFSSNKQPNRLFQNQETWNLDCQS